MSKSSKPKVGSTIYYIKENTIVVTVILKMSYGKIETANKQIFNEDSVGKEFFMDYKQAFAMWKYMREVWKSTTGE